MILSTIKSVVATLPVPVAFFYANLYEVQGDLGIPAFSEGKDVFFVYIPPLENDDEVEDSPLIHTKFPLQFLIMKRLEEPTTGYRSEEVDPVVDEMRALARRFIHLLNEQDVVEKGNTVNGNERRGITTWKITSEYGWSDHHLFGVSVQCDVPIMDGSTGCI